MVYLPHWPIPYSLGKREIDYEMVFERMNEVLKRLGNPHENLPPTIHVTGTNGKGSVIAFIAAILRSANFKVDVYSSPHLINCNERIVINGEKISDSLLYQIMEEARIASQETALSFFEGFTIGSMIAFSKYSTSDILLIEVGMGARIDPTNIIKNKLCSVITPISLDHCEYLGDDVGKIALEKSYIIKANTPVVIGPQPTLSKKIIEIIAKDQNAPLHKYEDDFKIEIDEETEKFDFLFNCNEFKDIIKPRLLGKHQYINASIAIATCLSAGIPITLENINFGMQNVDWPSRIEKINNGLSKIIKNYPSEIFIDGAHNLSGANSLAIWLQDEINSDKRNNIKKENYIIVGFSKNKCKKEFLAKFRDISTQVISTRVNGEPIPEEPSTISKIGSEISMTIPYFEDLLEIFNYINNITRSPCRIVICGSLHLARDVKKYGG